MDCAQLVKANSIQGQSASPAPVSEGLRGDCACVYVSVRVCGSALSRLGGWILGLALQAAR